MIIAGTGLVVCGRKGEKKQLWCAKSHDLDNMCLGMKTSCRDSPLCLVSGSDFLVRIKHNSWLLEEAARASLALWRSDVGAP